MQIDDRNSQLQEEREVVRHLKDDKAALQVPLLSAMQAPPPLSIPLSSSPSLSHPSLLPPALLSRTLSLSRTRAHTHCRRSCGRQHRRSRGASVVSLSWGARSLIKAKISKRR